jgi:hypothetical protein
MKTFPSEEVLVAAYWRKLACTVEAAYKSRGRAFTRHAVRALQTRQGSRVRSGILRRGTNL